MKDASGNLVQVLPDAKMTLPIYQGASVSDSGTAGLVPPASAVQKNNFLKGDGTWQEITSDKEIAVMNSAPTAGNTQDLENESIIFYADGSQSGDYAVPVTTSGNQSISGVKTFLNGLVGNVDGTAARAVNDADGNSISATYAKIADVDGRFEEYPESMYMTAQPSASDIEGIANGSIVFAESEDAGMYEPESVYTTGNQTVNGIKKFSAGLYSGVKTLAADESECDCTQAGCFVKTAAADTAFVFSNAPSDTACRITLVLINGGAWNIAWPSSVKWSGNAAATLSASGTDILSFFTCTGGTVWYGRIEYAGITA